MPKKFVSKREQINEWLEETKSEGFHFDGHRLFCVHCNKYISCDRKTQFVQHLKTDSHQNTGEPIEEPESNRIKKLQAAKRLNTSYKKTSVEIKKLKSNCDRNSHFVQPANAASHKKTGEQIEESNCIKKSQVVQRSNTASHKNPGENTEKSKSNFNPKSQFVQHGNTASHKKTGERIEESNCIKKSQATQNLNTTSHKNTVENVEELHENSEFLFELCEAMIAANMPFKTLNDKKFRNFLTKYTNKNIPDENALRINYLNTRYKKIAEEIQNETENYAMQISVDETFVKKEKSVDNL